MIIHNDPCLLSCVEEKLKLDSEDLDNNGTDKKSIQDTTATITEITPQTAMPETTTTAISDVSVASTTAEATTTTNVEKTTTTVDSSLFPTPTPFNFDLDFMGDGAQAASLKNNNDSFDVMPSELLNGSDKMLTAALDPSFIKIVRSCGLPFDEHRKLLQNELDQHSSSCNLPRTPIFVCKQCNQTFDELRKLLQHELDQHSSGTLSPRSSYQHQCDICHTTYRTVTLLNYHRKRHFTTRKVECKKCPKEFTSAEELEQHVDAEHRDKMILKCGVDGCKKTFNYKHHLKRHQTASHTPVQYICPECGRDMMTSLHLRNHMSMHRGTHSYKCPKCVRTYMRRNP